ncbi:MAG TPA: hypothetical protein VGC11_17135 [Acidimicrobiia bacterium]
MTTGRTTAVLERFPQHIGATDPGKRFEAVAGSLVADLDVLGRQVGDVRRALRLAEVPTLHDLLRLTALHAVAEPAFELTTIRHDTLAETAPDDTAALGELLGVEPVQLEAIDPGELGEALGRAVRFTARLVVLRESAARIIEAFRLGNATATALMHATAAYLAFDVTEVAHTTERWWHLARARDLVAVDRGDVVPGDDFFAIEENPFIDASLDPIARRHGDRFRVVRGGLEDVVATIDVVGVFERTVAPMVVNVDAGAGVVFTGSVPDGATVSFETSGLVLLDGGDVTGSAFRFDGAVFASSAEPHQKDFVFAGEGAPGSTDPTRFAEFVVTQPIAGGFAPAAALPHAGATVSPLPMPLGESRWAYFVRVAHFGSDPDEAVPSYAAGRFDGSVYADADGALDDPSGEVGFRWEEREPFALRVLLPQRLARLDDNGGTVVREPLRLLLERHRAAGVHVYVAYADDRWELGSGILRDAESDDPLGTIVSGTTLWPTPEE